MYTEQSPINLPSKARWKPSNTRARRLIVMRRMTYGQIARTLTERGFQCNDISVANVIRGRVRRPDLRKAIADYLGKPVEALWPDFHDDNAA